MSSPKETTLAIKFVAASDQMLTITLSDGRLLSLPLSWYPRLEQGTPRERNNWRLIGDGEGVHWPDLDEDLSLDGFIAGRRSGESPASFGRWLEAHRKAKKTPVRTLPLPSWAKAKGKVDSSKFAKGKI